MHHISFEFFPPSTPRGQESLRRTLSTLAPLGPRFVSVTCGAGGSTRRLTRDTLQRVRDESQVDSAPHLICVGASREEINDVVRDYADMGVRHIVALRGDPPRGQGPFKPHPRGYANAEALVSGLSQLGIPEISVAAYPEVHPEASSPRADIDNLKRKLDAGATRAITQFFFDVDTFVRFAERAAAAGIEAPIVPGILPVGSFARVRDFASRCGASIPRSLQRRFEDVQPDSDTHDRLATEVGAELCTRLREHGVTEFHFYTMNRSALPAAICRAAGLAP
jgi:methylenetetrahydrofolate reductase (NADPH)